MNKKNFSATTANANAKTNAVANVNAFANTNEFSNSNAKSIFKLAALIAIISFIAILIFQTHYCNHENHCHNENCQICLILQIIHNSDKILNQKTFAPIKTIFIFYINVLIFSALQLAPQTLVKQKIKLII
ncbi:MAG: hypothetical protein J6X84_01335 [Treponema sp.]|nr:hypothetical protein [Treponema sp.]